MTNYGAYKEQVGITNADLINAVAEQFPSYSKATNSMVCNPAKYGVCLLPEAEAHLVEKFGGGFGLNIAPKKKRDIRKKGNRLTVRIDDDLSCKVHALMAELHYSTVQDFLEDALKSMVKEV